MPIALRRVAVVIAALILTVACRQQEVDYRAVRRSAGPGSASHNWMPAPTPRGAASRVVVEAKDGTVTLTGSVDTPQDKALLEQTVGRTNGVKSVVNQINGERAGAACSRRAF